MIINEELFELEDQCERVITAILSSESFSDYKKAKNTLESSETVKNLKNEFQQQKDRFDRIASYGEYAPSYKEEKRALWRKKRKLDMNDTVAKFRLEETNLQGILDSIGQTIAETISEEIKVDAGNPFFETKHSGCGGHCHASK
ncbi:MAG: YlbF family regulator [Enterococcus sp.]